MKQLVEKMKKLVLESEPNIYYDQMLAVVKEMEAALTEKVVEAKPAPKKETAKPKSAEVSVEETVAKAVSKKAKKTTKTETSTEE